MSHITTPDSSVVKPIKDLLSHSGALAKHPKIHKADGVYSIYSSAPPDDTRLLLEAYPSVQIRPHEFGADAAASSEPGLAELITGFLASHNVSVTPDMASALPRKWCVYAPMVLFNAQSFHTPEWEAVFGSHVGRQLGAAILSFAGFRGCTHLAVNQPIEEGDEMRRPLKMRVLAGDFGPKPTAALLSSPGEADLRAAFFCHVTQNGLRQTWAPMYTMFSRGNIKEKKRLLDRYPRLGGTVAVDMYAGIGYFSMSYLRNGAAVFAWEINPWSVEGLRRGLELNGFAYKIFGADDHLSLESYHALRRAGIQAFVFHEPNHHAVSRLAPVAHELMVSHVNLGLLPTSRASWPVVRDILRPNRRPATVHVHENVHVGDFGSMRQSVEAALGGRVSHTEKVKTFAPDVWHVVMDVEMQGGSVPN